MSAGQPLPQGAPRPPPTAGMEELFDQLNLNGGGGLGINPQSMPPQAHAAATAPMHANVGRPLGSNPIDSATLLPGRIIEAYKIKKEKSSPAEATWAIADRKQTRISTKIVEDLNRLNKNKSVKSNNHSRLVGLQHKQMTGPKTAQVKQLIQDLTYQKGGPDTEWRPLGILLQRLTPLDILLQQLTSKGADPWDVMTVIVERTPRLSPLIAPGIMRLPIEVRVDITKENMEWTKNNRVRGIPVNDYPPTPYWPMGPDMYFAQQNSNGMNPDAFFAHQQQRQPPWSQNWGPQYNETSRMPQRNPGLDKHARQGSLPRSPRREPVREDDRHPSSPISSESSFATSSSSRRGRPLTPDTIHTTSDGASSKRNSNFAHKGTSSKSRDPKRSRPHSASPTPQSHSHRRRNSTTHHKEIPVKAREHVRKDPGGYNATSYRNRRGRDDCDEDIQAVHVIPGRSGRDRRGDGRDRRYRSVSLSPSPSRRRHHDRIYRRDEDLDSDSDSDYSDRDIRRRLGGETYYYTGGSGARPRMTPREFIRDDFRDYAREKADDSDKARRDMRRERRERREQRGRY